MKTGRALKTTTSARRRRFAAASIVALAAAGVTAVALPVSVFQASAIVAVDEPSAALRLAAARAAADLAVSKPVVSRAAASLNGTSVIAPRPALAETIGVATGLTAATGAVARLADALAPTISARASDGLVEVQASAADATRAARVATALAEALVAEEESSIDTLARRREASAGATLDALREVARDSHARLAALGATEADPAAALATAIASTRTAEARASAIHAVIAAGSPPLGAGTELPQGVATLQQTYWDLKKQLDKASETMGERHTTVIALRDGVSRAAASLTAEWQRIERGATNDLAAARSREAVLRKAATIGDPARRAAAEDARSAARLADAAVARSSALVAAAILTPTFRLVAPAGAPAVATGLGIWQRGTIAGGAGGAAFALALFALGRRRTGRWSAAAVPESAAISEKAAVRERETTAMPVPAPRVEVRAAMPPIQTRVPAKPVEAPRVQAVEPLVAPGKTSKPIESLPVDPAAERAKVAPEADDLYQPDDVYFDPEWLGYEPDDLLDDRTAAMPFESHSFDAEPHEMAEPHRGPAGREIDRDLRDALRAIAADLPMPLPGTSRPAMVMVAANATGADTGTVALALGEAAAELGLRVLVIEAERARSTLAEAVAPQGDPLLVDAFGALRVALPAEHGDGLFLAPAFRDGARIAAALARNTQADLVDDLTAVFDAVVIDGGRAADAAVAGWTADAFIRVGRFASHKDDAFFLEALDAPSEALLGTVSAGRFVARESEPALRPASRPALRAVPASFDAASPRRPAPAAPLRMPPRRRIGIR